MVETQKLECCFFSHLSRLRSLNRGMRWGRLQQITELSAEELPSASDVRTWTCQLQCQCSRNDLGTNSCCPCKGPEGLRFPKTKTCACSCSHEASR